ncbi:nitrophenyl compound nitroreductase subunit ArsF family protein [uncultured Sunxiuqinia sp.]|uniref:nitrophenyl compound nitroreductase subunit ArsF family protein n=1 Tax=uncultured Sunxiuqinia sp. TaxID=1573825 RepID=UPI002AA6E6B6|nr:nitrophenyl compound nitroreductase subunit ArsF family protein [uncultured Sunxiuqinia sp.]
MRLTGILFVGLLFMMACTNNQPIKSDDLLMPKPGQIGIYYFRTSIRCETCDAIEQLIKDELAGNYASRLKEGEIVFRQFNLDDPAVVDFAQQFDVVFKSVIILKDEGAINLTNDLFLYVLPKPEKSRELFENTIDQL